jgi:hypothetical protein
MTRHSSQAAALQAVASPWLASLRLAAAYRRKTFLSVLSGQYGQDRSIRGRSSVAGSTAFWSKYVIYRMPEPANTSLKMDGGSFWVLRICAW